MIYQNNDLRIVPFEMSSHMTERYRSWFHDPETTRFNSYGLFPYTPAAMRNFVSTIENGDPNKIVWAIEIRVGQLACAPGAIPGPLPPVVPTWRHVGNCSLQMINWINRSAEFAVVIGEAEARGHGVGKKVCKWLIQHAFIKLNLNRVWTGTVATNMAMRKTAVACGMRQEGTFCEGMFLNGRYEDVIAFGILKGQKLA